MKFSYKWLQEYIPKLPRPEKLAELLTLHSFEVEALEKKGSDWILDIDLLPNRMPDASGHLGMAREISAIANVKFRDPIIKVKEDRKLLTRRYVKVEVKNKDLCPRYTARYIEGVKVKKSPKWLQNRLEILGIQPISNIVDVANYVMLETGQPLHVFDFDKLDKEIVVRQAKKGEKMETLDGEVKKLDSSILVIADTKDPIAIAGIKGGTKAAVDKNTTRIVLESANFDGVSVYKAARSLNLWTDAALRFSAGIDPNKTESAINRLALLIQNLAGGKIAKGLVDVYLRPRKPKSIPLRLHRVTSVLGIDISENRIQRLLVSLGFGVRRIRTSGKKGAHFIVDIPTDRLDISLEEDLIEEIGRLFGYERIVGEHLRFEMHPPHQEDEIIVLQRTRDILVGMSFDEVINYSFVGDKDVEGVIDKSGKYFELENPTRPEFKYLRRKLLPYLLRNTKENLKNFDEFSIFEIGKVFGAEPQAQERTELVAVICSKQKPVEQIFARVKGAVSTLFERLGITDFYFDDFEKFARFQPYLHPHQAAAVRVGGKKIGVVGMVHPIVKEHFGIRGAGVGIFGLNFSALIQEVRDEYEYESIPKFPALTRDISLLVQVQTRVEEVLNIIENMGGKLLFDTDLFDLYMNKQLDGLKSMAFHLTFQSKDRTLSDKEVDAIMKKIYKEVKQKGWEVR